LHARAGPCFEIRPCREKDLRLLEWSEAYREHREIIERTFARQQAGHALMLLGVASAFPIAQVWMDFGRLPERRVLLWAVRTHPRLRGRGIGSSLLRRAERVAAERGKAVAELGVEHANHAALRFYTRLGYRTVGEFAETCRYRSPEGEHRTWTIHQWKLRKRLHIPRRLPRRAA
jgi:ribosomal protein S18 acetylase RimI-like enzyme